MAEENLYQVVITNPAGRRYQNTFLTYLAQHYSAERVIEIDRRVIETVETLKYFPNRGRQEELLEDVGKFRFILFQESRSIELKIIYLIDEKENTVYVTDFFPTRMNREKIRRD